MKTLGVVLVVLLTLSSVVFAASNELTVYTPAPKELVNLVIPMFEKEARI